MPQPPGPALDEIRARRERYLRPAADRPATTAAGVHHVALICSDVEETIRFYQEFLGFPLVELAENRDYPGSSHFFFDLGNRNLLGFFDFPATSIHRSPRPSAASSIWPSRCRPSSSRRARRRFDQAGLEYLGPDRGWTTAGTFRDPNWVGLELYREDLGQFLGEPLLG
jgi:glyoxylase I family protein